MNPQGKERATKSIRPWSRREVLAWGIAAAGAWTGRLTLAEERAAEANPAPDIRFGFTTYTWGKDWDIPTLIANCQSARVLGVELRTSGGYAHGVELEISAAGRREVQDRFRASPITLVGLATSERFDMPDSEQVKQAVENARSFLRLSHDVGGSGIRVFPNDYHADVPREKTIAQIAKALNEVGVYAKDYGQEVRLEAHGSAGDLASIHAIMEQVEQPSVRVKLNSTARDAEGEGFEHNFNLVRKYLGTTLHLHDQREQDFPYLRQLQLLAQTNWRGWALLEASHAVPDRLQALIGQRELFDKMLATATHPS